MIHSNITGVNAIHPFAYVQSTDPALVPANNVTAYKAWLDTSTTPATFRYRNAANTAWLQIQV